MDELKYNNNEIEHLRMIQGIINRMGNTSLGIKRYSLMVFTFVSAYLIIGQETNKFLLFVLSIFIFVSMLMLDMYYLSMEKAYRNKFNDFRENRKIMELFDLGIDEISRKTFIQTLISKSIYLFYLPLIIAIIALYFLV